jgi:hypothetical protein
VLERVGVRGVDLFLGADVDAPVVEQVHGLQRIADLYRDDVELEPAAHRDRGLGVAHAL